MSESKSAHKNKAVYRRFIQGLFNEGRLDRLNDLVHPDYVLHNPPPGAPSGPAAIKYAVSMFQEGFPDLEITLDELIAEEDLLAARSTFRGTHKGTIFGIAPTGTPVTMPGLTMVRVSEGRISESWVRNDILGLMNQIKPEFP